MVTALFYVWPLYCFSVNCRTLTLIESSLDQELSVVRCPFWVEPWRGTELYLFHGEVIEIGFFGYSVFCLLNSVFFQLSFFAQLGPYKLT